MEQVGFSRSGCAVFSTGSHRQGQHGGTRLALFKVKDGCIEDGTMSEAQNVAWCLCVEKGMWETELS